MSKRIPTPASKEIADYFGCHSSSVLKRLPKLRLREKKEYVLQRTSPQKVDAYLEKIKTFPSKSTYRIDETSILQTQMFHQYARSKRGKRVNIRISSQLINAIYRLRLSPCKKEIHVYPPALNNFAAFKKDIALPVFEMIVKLT